MAARSETHMQNPKESRISHIPQLPPPRYGHSPSSPGLGATERFSDTKEPATISQPSLKVDSKPSTFAENVQKRLPDVQQKPQPEPQSLRHTSALDLSPKFNIPSFLAGVLFTILASHVVGKGYLRLIAAIIFGAAASALYASLASPAQQAKTHSHAPTRRSRALSKTEKRPRRSSPSRVPVPDGDGYAFRPYGPRRGSETRSIRSGNDLWLGDK